MPKPTAASMLRNTLTFSVPGLWYEVDAPENRSITLASDGSLPTLTLMGAAREIRGPGIDAVVFRHESGAPLTVLNIPDVDLLGGAFRDNVSLLGAATVNLSTGAGHDDITWTAARSAPTNQTSAAIAGGEGADTVRVFGSLVPGIAVSANIDMGAGDDRLDVVGTTSLFVKAGLGDDLISLSVVGKGELYGGAGDDTLRLNYNAASIEFAVVSGVLRLRNPTSGASESLFIHQFETIAASDRTLLVADMMAAYGSGSGWRKITTIQAYNPGVAPGGTPPEPIAAAEPVRIFDGTSGADTISATNGADLLRSLGGADRLAGKGGDDTYLLGTDAQLVRVLEGAAEGVDHVILTTGAPSRYILTAWVENLSAQDAAGIIRLEGNELANRITGNASANTLDGRGGNDLLTGGPGADLFIHRQGEGFDVIADFTPGIDRLKILDARIGSWADIQSRLHDGPHGTVLRTGPDDGVLFAGLSASQLSAADFDLPIRAAFSLDGPVNSTRPNAVWTIADAAPVTTLLSEALGLTTGSPVTVRITHNVNTDAVTIASTGRWAGVRNVLVEAPDGGHVTVDNFALAEIFIGGSAGSNVRIGSSQYGSVSTGSGADIVRIIDAVHGLGGSSKVFWVSTGAGDDRILGWSNIAAGGMIVDAGAGNDVIDGSAGSDFLRGGTGSDRLTGRDGADTFAFARRDGVDTIVDFTPGVDTILLENVTRGEMQLVTYNGWATLRGPAMDVVVSGIAASGFSWDWVQFG